MFNYGLFYFFNFFQAFKFISLYIVEKIFQKNKSLLYSFMYIKCLKTHQLYIIKKIKKSQKKSFRKYRSLSKEEKIESDNMVVNDRKSTRR